MLDKELEVYAHPSWDAFVRRLEELEHKALAELIEGTGDPASARAKVKLLRHLVGIPDWVRDERARIETELEEA